MIGYHAGMNEETFENFIGFARFFFHIVLSPKSELQRRHSLPSFAAQGISDLGAASLDAAHCGHETPCTSKPGNDFLAFDFGSRGK
jgi:hypothetical protein